MPTVIEIKTDTKITKASRFSDKTGLSVKNSDENENVTNENLVAK